MREGVPVWNACDQQCGQQGPAAQGIKTGVTCACTAAELLVQAATSC